MQFQVTVEVPPHAGGEPNDAEHMGRFTQVVVAMAVAIVPPLPGAVMEQVSPAAFTTTVVEPVHGTAPLPGVEPVQV